MPCRRLSACRCVRVLTVGVHCLLSTAGYIKVCKRNDPNLNDCIRDSIENLRPQLKAGKSCPFVPRISTGTEVGLLAYAAGALQGLEP